MEDEMKLLLAKLIEILDDISSFSEFHCSVRHQCRHLLRRLRLLAPLFEELQEFQGKVPENTIKAFVSLMDSFIKAKDWLQFCSNGSKIYMVRFSLFLSFLLPLSLVCQIWLGYRIFENVVLYLEWTS